MNRTHQIETVLRTMNAAPDRYPTSKTQSEALLERVVAAGTAEDRAPAPTTTATIAHRARPRPGARALLVTGGLVAATTAGLFVIPPLLGVEDSAYASWTAVPDDLSAQERPDAAEDCRTAQLEGPGGGDAYPQLHDATVAIAERRGAWITVVLAGPEGFSATCTTDASDPFGDGWVGSAGVPADWEPLGPRDLLVSGLGVAHSSGPLSMAEGYAGADVIGITYDSAEHGTVVATVSGGHFAFWMPGDELDDDLVFTTGVPVDVTYTDGSTNSVDLQF